MVCHVSQMLVASARKDTHKNALLPPSPHKRTPAARVGASCYIELGIDELWRWYDPFDLVGRRPVQISPMHSQVWSQRTMKLALAAVSKLQVR